MKQPAQTGLIATVKLWIHPQQRAGFEAFEQQAFRIMRRHGAEILRLETPDQSAPDAPHEIHILHFPSEQAFQAYRDDPHLKALANLRERCIARTVVETASQPA